MAGFRRGVVHMAMKQTKDAEEDFLNCWARRPWRAEPLRHLAQIYLDTNRQTHACAIAKAALNIPYPKHDLLFIEHPCYHDEFHRILSIGAFYAGRQYDGAGHSDALILRKGASHKQNALQNASWYMERLPVKRTVNLGDMVELKEGWHACNPSIIRPFIGSSGYHASIRTVNYTINPDGSYNYPGYVATETYWVELDGDLNKVKPAIKLQNPRSEQPNALIRGVEDVRFYAYSNTEIIALGVRADGEEARPQLFHCNWDNTGKLTLCERASAPGRTEKNWLPFIEGGVSKAIYTTGPDLTIVPIGKTGDTLTSPSCIDARDFRGGGGPIKFYGGCLWTVHQVTVRSGMSRRTYLHRFVWVPENWDASKMRCSRPFCFQDQTIEFCSGLARGDNECLLAYGVLDNTAHLAVVDDQVILNMLGLGGRA